MLAWKLFHNTICQCRFLYIQRGPTCGRKIPIIFAQLTVITAYDYESKLIIFLQRCEIPSSKIVNFINRYSKSSKHKTLRSPCATNPSRRTFPQTNLKPRPVAGIFTSGENCFASSERDDDDDEAKNKSSLPVARTETIIEFIKVRSAKRRKSKFKKKKKRN